MPLEIHRQSVLVHCTRAATIVYSGGDVVIVDAPNGVAKVVTDADQVDSDGVYKAQAWLQTGAGLYPSELLQFTVRRSIAEPAP